MAMRSLDCAQFCLTWLSSLADWDCLCLHHSRSSTVLKALITSWAYSSAKSLGYFAALLVLSFLSHGAYESSSIGGKTPLDLGMRAPMPSGAPKRAQSAMCFSGSLLNFCHASHSSASTGI